MRDTAPWRLAAACRFADPELFFPVSATGRSIDQVALAKSVCAECIVRRQCLEFALATREPHGVWGGMTEEERGRIATRAARRAAEAVMSGRPTRRW